MELLRRKAAPELPVRVLQFGEGNFMRAFVDWMIDCMNRRGRFNGMVQMIQPLPHGMGELINQQDGLYTLFLRGFSGGRPVETRGVIESVKGCINPYADWAAAVAAACLPEVRFVFSNTTEAGIEYREEPYTPGECQHTYPAKLTSLMHSRWQSCAGAPERGIVFIPCELIENNGGTLRQCMLRYAALWQLPSAFVQWLQESCLFVNSLVDRIVAGYPRTEAEQLCGQLGYRDNLLDCGELFHFFVLEGPQSIRSELPLAECGLNVVVTDRLEPYRTRKVRFLNGAHTADVPAALMGGLTYVDEMMNDPVFGRMVRSAVYDEIFPTVALPEKEKRFYADSVVERFLNPYAGHRLQSISLNSVSKWKVRVLPTLLDFLAARRELPPVLSFSLAALLRFYRVHPAGDGRFCGELGEVKWEVADSPGVVDFFAGTADLPSPEYVRRALANAAFWGMDLTGVAGLEQCVAERLTAIERLGIRSAVEEALRR